MAEFEQPIQPQSEFVKKVAFVLDEWHVLTVVSEKTFVGNLASTIPWIAPLVPAWFAFENSTDETKLGLPMPVGIIIAASIEGLGIGVVTTALELWDWNDRHKDQKVTAPIYVSVGTVVFYLGTVIMVNVGLDLGWSDWIVKIMLSMLSIPAVITLALRSQHARRVAAHEAVEIKAEQSAIADQDEKRRQEEAALEVQRKQMDFEFEQKRLDAEARRLLKLERVRAESEKVSKLSGNFPKEKETFQKVSESLQWRTLKKKLSDAQLYAILRQPKNELAIQYGKTEKAVEKWAVYAAEEINTRGLKAETVNT
ncbi:MAG: hypothetical protein HY865_22295 [Chloroflexi bacterium]|nr:hypothetical protein [Chloroflexota bacterium]